MVLEVYFKHFFAWVLRSGRLLCYNTSLYPTHKSHSHNAVQLTFECTPSVHLLSEVLSSRKFGVAGLQERSSHPNRPLW